MVDVAETPAVSPERVGGDERLGLQIAGGLLLVVGFGLGIVANLYLHDNAGPSGTSFGPWTISSGLGSYAWATVAFGVFASVIGAGFLWIARRDPKGPILLPGAPL